MLILLLVLLFALLLVLICTIAIACAVVCPSTVVIAFTDGAQVVRVLGIGIANDMTKETHKWFISKIMEGGCMQHVY